jgi:hypothetical protein
MTGEQPRTESEDLTPETAERLQQQIDDLTATVESHQLLFERLRAAGLLPGDGEPGRR